MNKQEIKNRIVLALLCLWSIDNITEHQRKDYCDTEETLMDLYEELKKDE